MDKRLRSSPEETIIKTNMKFDIRKLPGIKVELKRKRIPPPNEVMQVIHTVDKPEEIKIHLKEGEGSRPIFDRSDIIVNKEETEHRTVSTYSPHKSPGRSQNNSHRSSDNYTSFGSDSPRRVRDRESPRRSSRYSRSPREHKSSKSNRRSSSLHRESSRPSSSRRDVTSSRNRSRSRDSSRRSRRSRSRSRSSRREFGRRRNSRSPVDRDRRRYERRTYGPNERDRRRNRSRSPRYGRRSPRRRSRSRPPHMAPIDPTTVIPLILPPFYGAEEAVWFPPPLRPPMLMPPGIPMHPRGMYRGPIPGMRPPMPGRPPFMPPRQAPFRQIRPQNRPQLQ